MTVPTRGCWPKSPASTKHDIATFFGVNPGRIAAVESGRRFPVGPCRSRDPAPAARSLPRSEGRLASRGRTARQGPVTRCGDAGVTRDTVFISHATPDDNDFVRWLGTRLRYNVWADLFELKGGNPFWSTIEEALRHHACKMIFVVSKASVDPERTGTLNELSVADALKKQLKDDTRRAAAFEISIVTWHNSRMSAARLSVCFRAHRSLNISTSSASRQNKESRRRSQSTCPPHENPGRPKKLAWDI
jgi:TIR domain